MRRQTLIALGIAVVLGLFAVYLANTFLTSTEQRAQVAEQGMTKVAVAVVPLDYGVDITPDKIRFADYPVASVPPGSFRTLAELLPAGKRRVALRPMLVNEPILATKNSGEGQGASIAPCCQMACAPPRSASTTSPASPALSSPMIPSTF